MTKLKKTVLLTILTLSGVLAACGSSSTAQPNQEMKTSQSKKEDVIVQQIRNATVTVEYRGQKFLVDPMFSKKGQFESFGPAARDDRNPIVDLPFAVDKIMDDVDAVIVTHTHEDHFDQAAKEQLPKDIKMFMQDKMDAEMARKAGFTNIEVMKEDKATTFKGVKLTEVDGRHGYGKMAEAMGNVMGVVFQHPKEKTLYIAGDTVWYSQVKKNIDTYKPELFILNGGQNQFLEGGPLIMGKEDVYQVYKAAPKAKILVSHMEAVNHWGLSRKELKTFIKDKGITSNVLVPNDGETISF